MAALTAALPAARLDAQGMTPAFTNFDAAGAGITVLCPQLMGGRPVPDEATSRPFGLRPISSPSGQYWFQGRFDDGNVELLWESASRVCTVRFTGRGFEHVARAARDIPIHNGFSRVAAGTDDRPSEAVFERLMDLQGRHARVMVVEDPASQTATIAYSERVGP